MNKKYERRGFLKGLYKEVSGGGRVENTRSRSRSSEMLTVCQSKDAQA